MLEFSRNSMGGQEVRGSRPTQGRGVVGLLWDPNWAGVLLFCTDGVELNGSITPSANGFGHSNPCDRS